jgi:hypothetical protein
MGSDLNSKLDLPDGMKVGSIILAKWDVAASARQGVHLMPGPFEGRVIGIKGNKITVRFEYGRECDPQEDTVVIDLETGLDSVDHGVVSEIVLKTASG